MCLVLAAAALAGSASLQTSLDRRRAALHLTNDQANAPKVPPQLRLIQAMPGWARSILLQVAWIRSQENKQEGKSFDAEQLAWTICRLQWRYPGVWSYLSWDLAWNWSVQKHTPQERWKWVSAGLRLLQDEGIQANPDSVELYKQLGWIYFSKIGGTSDDMHLYYKRYLAAEMHRLFGAPPRPGETSQVAEWLRKIADAPANEAHLTADESVRAYVQQLRRAGLELDWSLLDAYNRWSDDPLVKMIDQPMPKPAGDREADWQRLMTDPALEPARAAVVAFVRRKTLVETYHMDPQWMLELTGKYGPLDWRLPWPHALYWSTYGVHHVEGFDIEDINSLNTERNVLNSLKDLTVRGQLTLLYNRHEPDLPELRLDPNWRYVKACHDEHVLNNQAVGDPDKVRLWTMDGHINYLIEAITALYFGGQEAEAVKYFNYIRQEYKPTDPKWNLPLEEFIIYSVNEAGTPRQAAAEGMVFALLNRACVSLVSGNVDDYEFSIKLAQRIWVRYNEDRSTARTRLADFNDLLALVAGRQMAGFSYAGRIQLAGLLYRGLPIEIRQICYVLYEQPLREALLAHNQRQDQLPPAAREYLDFDLAFPVPPGVDDVREAIEKRLMADDPTRQRPE